MSTAHFDQTESRVARRLAGEDVRQGQFVSVLYETVGFPSFFWCGDSAVAARSELVHIRRHSPWGGVPLKVKAVCLPFVFVKPPTGKSFPIDVRQSELVHLPQQYGELVWKRMKRKKRK